MSLAAPRTTAEQALGVGTARPAVVHIPLAKAVTVRPAVSPKPTPDADPQVVPQRRSAVPAHHAAAPAVVAPAPAAPAPAAPRPHRDRGPSSVNVESGPNSHGESDGGSKH